MTKPFFKIPKLLKYLLILLLILTITFCVIFRNGINTLYGGKTEMVDLKEILVNDDPVVINNISVLSIDGTEFHPNYSVYIDKGQIIKVDSLIEIEEIRTIDGTGKYLIPGLIDSHIHLFNSPNDLLLYIANGVTHIREMIGNKDHLKWKKEIHDGRLGPDMYVASPRFGSFNYFKGIFMSQTQGFVNVTGTEDAKKKVIEYYKQGYDGIKIYSHLNKEAYLAISEIADSLDMDMIGHIPFNIELIDLWRSSQREIAHFEEIMNALNREFGHFRNEHKEEFLRFIDERSDSVAHQLLENNIAVTSTLWGMNSLYRQKTDLRAALNEIELKYVNPGIIEGHTFTPQGGLGWLPGVNRVRLPDGLSQEEIKGRVEYWLIYAEACRRIGLNLYERGVTILAGTDANLSIKVPGFSLHDELSTLQDLGMSPIDVLKSATMNPAKWLNENRGQIKEGFEADLLILNKNPLLDIHNTQSINTVISDGQVFNRQQLDKLLSAIEEANTNSRTINIE